MDPQICAVHSAGTDVKDVGVPRPCPEIGHCRVPDVQAAAFHLQKGAGLPGHAGHGGRAARYVHG